MKHISRIILMLLCCAMVFGAIPSAVSAEEAAKKAAEEASIPEFKRFNIMESDIKNLA